VEEEEEDDVEGFIQSRLFSEADEGGVNKGGREEEEDVEGTRKPKDVEGWGRRERERAHEGPC